MPADNPLHETLHLFKTQLCAPYGFTFTGFSEEEESREYGACRFRLNSKTVIFRISKITPTKAGQFVTIWKRNDESITQPFHENDGIDFIIICSQSDEYSGLFIFPKPVLIKKGMISTSRKKGKRGTRVYPPWDKPANKQAEKTQQWQCAYFVYLQEHHPAEQAYIKRLFMPGC